MAKIDNIPYEEIIADLNSYQSNRYKHKSSVIRALIRARWDEGYTLEDFKYVHAVKFSNWQGEKIDGRPALRYFQPSTLYRASKFPMYREEKFNHEYLANQFADKDLTNLKHVAEWVKEKGKDVDGQSEISIWPGSEKPVPRIPNRD